MTNSDLNPFSKLFDLTRYKNCIYFSSEDITDKISGGHIEILSDIYFFVKNI